MLTGYAGRDHHGTDQAKEGIDQDSRSRRQERQNRVHGKPHPQGLIRIRAPVRHRGKDAHAMRSLLERR